MPITVRVVGFPESVGIQRVHRGDPVALKFVAFQEGDGITVVMGFISQHRALALIHTLQYDIEKLRDFYQAYPADYGYPQNIYQLKFVAGGWISVRYRRQVRVPAEGEVRSWESRSLRIVTDAGHCALLEPVLLAHVDEAVVAEDVANPPPASFDEF